jgi:hypothetical protein
MRKLKILTGYAVLFGQLNLGGLESLGQRSARTEGTNNSYIILKGKLLGKQDTEQGTVNTTNTTRMTNLEFAKFDV